jgi:glycosyltransferase involved in cell wall biosynthesis
MDRPLKVAHVVLSMNVGGLERVVLALTHEGMRLGQEVAIVCIETAGTLAATAEALGATVVSAGKRPGVQWGLRRTLREIFKRLRPDVVHTHQVGALFYAGPAARKVGVPAIIHTEHGKHYAARFRTRILGRIAARSAQRFCCVAGDVADEVKRYRIAPEGKLTVVPNGIDTARFLAPPDAQLRRSLGIPEGAPVVGTIGRLCEVKRQDVLLKAFATLRRGVPDAHLILVGEGPLRGELERLARELGVARVTHLAGYQSQPERFLPLMNVFALTSRSEGMPLAVLEAWAAGVPVVASAVGGLPELIEQDRTGLLFPALDEDALAAAVGRLLLDRASAAAMGTRGREWVQSQYTLDRMAQRYRQHYLELLRAARGTRDVGSTKVHLQVS